MHTMVVQMSTDPSRTDVVTRHLREDIVELGQATAGFRERPVAAGPWADPGLGGRRLRVRGCRYSRGARPAQLPARRGPGLECGGRDRSPAGHLRLTGHPPRPHPAPGRVPPIPAKPPYGNPKPVTPAIQEGTAVELIIMLLAPFPIGFFIRNRMAAYLAYLALHSFVSPSRAPPCSGNGTAATTRRSSRTRPRWTGPTAWSTCSSSPPALAWSRLAPGCAPGAGARPGPRPASPSDSSQTTFIYCPAHQENDGAARCGLPAGIATRSP